MALTNSSNRFGSVTRSLHWLAALLILTAIPLGIVANRLPYDTAGALALKAQVFSIHKTLGVAVFFVAAVRILWALTQRQPVALHPERKAETALAGVVHWMVYISLLAVPVTGWVHHASLASYAPILWPFGQGLPFGPMSKDVAIMATSLHWVCTKLLITSILLHVAGALKHHLIDRDATLMRMWRGTAATAAIVHGGMGWRLRWWQWWFTSRGRGLRGRWWNGHVFRWPLPRLSPAPGTGRWTRARSPLPSGRWGRMWPGPLPTGRRISGLTRQAEQASTRCASTPPV
jgi:cytochrome b561